MCLLKIVMCVILMCLMKNITITNCSFFSQINVVKYKKGADLKKNVKLIIMRVGCRYAKL